VISLRGLIRTALIAGLYFVLTVGPAPVSYGPIQCRISEALTVLPFLTPLAIPGLTLGCLLANWFGPFGPVDIVGGSLATLLAAVMTRYAPRPWLAPLPPVLTNGLIVGAYVGILSGLPTPLVMGEIALGELVACYALGLPLLLWLRRRPDVVAFLRGEEPPRGLSITGDRRES